MHGTYHDGSKEEGEVIENFGGSVRLDTLTRFIAALRLAGVTLFVLSHGRRAAIERLLQLVHLSGYFQKASLRQICQSCRQCEG